MGRILFTRRSRKKDRGKGKNGPPLNRHRLSFPAEEQGHPISALLFGVSFEDINHSSDGGLNSQLVKNPFFNFPGIQSGWYLDQGESQAFIQPVEGYSKDENSHLIELYIEKLEGSVRLENSGYLGIPLKSGSPYDLELRFCSPDRSVPRVTVFIENPDREVLFKESFTLTDVIRDYSSEVVVPSDISDGRLVLQPEGEGRILLEKVSLFPRETYNGRPGGLRKDLAECIAFLKPSFLRFPGGTIVEGASIGNAYNWKDTVGPPMQRKPKENHWGYTQSYGVGFFEFFQFCEDMGAEPVPVLFPGLSSQYLRGDIVPISQLSPYIQNALDLIEYANGAPDSEWGSKRAEAGHNAPFDLKYIAIGNMQLGRNFFLRFRKFFDAIYKTYPEITIIMGGSPGKLTKSGEIAEILQISDKEALPILDEHHYMSPQWFLNHTDLYSTCSRGGPKYMVGEYCCLNYDRSSNLMAALAEAAFMLGLEKDSDLVTMASYAPLLAKEGATQWEPDLIHFNNTSCIRTPGYYVQQLLNRYKGEFTVPVELSGSKTENEDQPIEGRIGFSSWETETEYRNLEVTARDGTILMKGFGPVSEWEQNGTWRLDGKTESLKGNKGTERILLLGRPDWKNYTLKVQAKKISGKEGFLILFGAKSLKDYYWINLGGFGNTNSAIERAQDGLRELVDEEMPVTVENNRWYDISFELSGSRVRIYLDGTLIKELKDYQHFDPLHGGASRNGKGDLYIKLINASDEAREISINLPPHLGPFKEEASLIQLAGAREDKNSFDEPEKITPGESLFKGVNQEFDLPLPPWSLNILCLEKGD